MLMFTCEGDRNAGEVLLNLPNSPDYKLKLFTNNVTITKTMLLAALEEMSGYGYAALTLTHGQWTISTNEENKTFGEYEEQVWTFQEASGAKTIYGYYIVRASDETKILWCEKLPSPVPLYYANAKVRVKPLVEFN